MVSKKRGESKGKVEERVSRGEDGENKICERMRGGHFCFLGEYIYY